MKRALVSVSDKTNLVPFVKRLVELGYEIISPGGTKKALEEAGMKVISIDEVTGFKEILEGRVKTLHPMVHGGLLAKREDVNHQQQVKENNIEYIDIGGPSMLRSAAKNFNDVTVIVDAADYDLVISEIEANQNTTLKTRQMLAGKVFNHTAAYDAMIAKYFNDINEIKFPPTLTVTYDLKQGLRYGENPHQKAAFYQSLQQPSYSAVNSQQLHGKELSYNNIADANAALEILQEFEGAAAVAVKHMNPCGVGLGITIEEAYEKAYQADPVSIFGGIVALNQEVSKELAEKLHQLFLEIVIVPSFSAEALEILTQKKNIRLLVTDMNQRLQPGMKLSSVKGGLLVQELDTLQVKESELECVTEVQPTEEDLKQLLFGFNVCKHVKSNAITLVKNDMTIGVGAGQMNRVGSAKIALEQAGDLAKGSYLASDAFFPMSDTVELAAKYGINAIIQPGGSIKDQDSIDACNKHGICMVFTKVRHFKH